MVIKNRNCIPLLSKIYCNREKTKKNFYPNAYNKSKEIERTLIKKSISEAIFVKFC